MFCCQYDSYQHSEYGPKSYVHLVTFGFNEESASIFFHALKYTKVLTELKITRTRFNTESFLMLSEFIRSTRSLDTLYLEDLDNLGTIVS